MASIFSRIVNGEIPAHKVAENDDYLAFLDIFPLARGHVLVIPKLEIDYVFDLDDELLSGCTLTWSVSISTASSRCRRRLATS